MNEQLIKDLTEKVKRREMTWKQANDIYCQSTRENTNTEQFRGRSRRLSDKVEKVVNNTSESYETKYQDGTIEAQKIVEYNKEIFGDTNKLLSYLGYDPNTWEFVYVSTSVWQQHTKEQITKQMYAVKFKVKPLFKKELSMQEYMNIAKEIFSKEIPALEITPDRYDVLTKDTNKLMELTGCELHLGKMAWSGDTGQDYDKNIAQERFYKILEEIVEQQEVEQCDTCLLCIGNDFFNSDTVNATTTKGTPQTNDLRWKKMFNLGLEMYLREIETLKPLFNNIEVRLQSGNHDKMASFYLYIALSCFYANDPKIHFDTNYRDVQVFEWGKCAIAFTHGDTNLKRLIKSIPVEFREAWSRCPFFELHLGHLHKEVVVDDESGIITRRVGSPTGTDQWHYEERFIGSTQKYQTFIWDKEKGLQSIKYINFDETGKKKVKKREWHNE